MIFAFIMMDIMTQLLIVIQTNRSSVFVLKACFNKTKKISPLAHLLKKSTTKIPQNFETHFKVSVTHCHRHNCSNGFFLNISSLKPIFVSYRHSNISGLSLLCKIT